MATATTTPTTNAELQAQLERLEIPHINAILSNLRAIDQALSRAMKRLGDRYRWSRQEFGDRSPIFSYDAWLSRPEAPGWVAKFDALMPQMWNVLARIRLVKEELERRGVGAVGTVI